MHESGGGIGGRGGGTRLAFRLVAWRWSGGGAEAERVAGVERALRVSGFSAKLLVLYISARNRNRNRNIYDIMLMKINQLSASGLVISKRCVSLSSSR